MIGFVVTKSFQDFWESFTGSLFFNLAVVIVVAGVSLLGSFFGPVGTFAAATFSILLLFSAFSVFRSISLHKKFSSAVFKRILGYALLTNFAFVFGIFAIYVYGSWNSVAGTTLSLSIVWVLLFGSTSTYFVLPLLERHPLHKAFALSFRLFVENPLEVIFASLLGSVLFLSTLVLIPGFAGMLFFQNRVLEALERKYDWMEEQNLEDAPRPFPWKTALSKEIASLPSNPVRSLLFPWKN